MNKKIQELLARLPVVEEALGQPDVFDDQKKYRELTREHSYLQSVKESWEALQKAEKELADSREMLSAESDPEFTEVLREEIAQLEAALPELQSKLEASYTQYAMPMPWE